MKFLLFILIIDNLNVALANNDNCGLNDLNALMVRLRQLRTEFNDLKTEHEATQAEIKALKEANRKQETELEELRQEVNNTSLEIASLSKDIEMIKDIDDCSPNQCQNGATCVDGVTSYTCSCVAGYNGTLCEIVEKCPANWNFFRESCYFYSTKYLNWLKAENDCITLGGHLVEITSEEENDFITSIIRNHVWIGLNNTVTENVFVWVSSGNTLGVYTKWAPGEPENYTNQDCVLMSYTTGYWGDTYCSYDWHYICEKESMFA